MPDFNIIYTYSIIVAVTARNQEAADEKSREIGDEMTVSVTAEKTAHPAIRKAINECEVNHDDTTIEES